MQVRSHPLRPLPSTLPHHKLIALYITAPHLAPSQVLNPSNLAKYHSQPFALATSLEHRAQLRLGQAFTREPDEGSSGCGHLAMPPNCSKVRPGHLACAYSWVSCRPALAPSVVCIGDRVIRSANEVEPTHKVPGCVSFRQDEPLPAN